jgi:hypothetical protein
VREVSLQILVGPAVVADVGVAVDETRRNIESIGVQDFRCFATRVHGARTDVANSLVKDPNFHPIENFPRINVDKFAAGYDEVGLHFSHCPLNQAPQFCLCSHDSVCSTPPFTYQSCVGIEIAID